MIGTFTALVFGSEFPHASLYAERPPCPTEIQDRPAVSGKHIITSSFSSHALLQKIIDFSCHLDRATFVIFGIARIKANRKVYLGARAANYDTLRGTISALEFTALGWHNGLIFLVFGLMLMTFALALGRELGAGRGAVLIPTFQFLSGVGVAGDAIFIHEPLHLVCNLIAFNSSLLVLLLFAWRFSGDSRWKRWTAYSILTTLLMMAFLTAFGLLIILVARLEPLKNSRRSRAHFGR